MEFINQLSYRRLVAAVVICVVGPTHAADLQSTESHATQFPTLAELVQASTRTHPSIKATEFDLQASEEELIGTKRQRWPTVSGSYESEQEGKGSAPSRFLRIEQTIWDAGQISAKIEEADANISVNRARIKVSSQQISVQVVNSWQALVAAIGRIKTARETLDLLGTYRDRMLRRVQAEVSAPVDLELVSARINQTRVELNQAESSKKIAISKLEQLTSLKNLGKSQIYESLPYDIKYIESAITNVQDLDLQTIVNTHPSLLKVRYEADAARKRLEAKRSEAYPTLYARVDQQLSTNDNRVAGFIGIKYSSGAGFSTLKQADALVSKLLSLNQSVEVAERELFDSILNDREEFVAASGRVAVLNHAITGSQTVLESYERQFVAGRKSFLDLINAVRESTQNMYSLADAQALSLASLYRLKVRIGEELSFQK